MLNNLVILRGNPIYVITNDIRVYLVIELLVAAELSSLVLRRRSNRAEVLIKSQYTFMCAALEE